MNNRQKFGRAALLSVFFCLIVLALQPAVFAQSPDSERVNRIRKQMAPESGSPLTEELEPLRDDMAAAVASLTSRLDALEKDNADLRARIKAMEARANVTAANSVIDSSLQSQGRSGNRKKLQKANVSMCASGCDADRFKEALRMVEDNGTVTVAPGEYHDCAIVNKPVTLSGAGAHLKGSPCSDKAAIVVGAANVTIDGFEISRIYVSDGNGACIRAGVESGGLALRNINCHHSQMGVLGNIQNGDILIEDSLIHDTASNSAYAHAIYITYADHFTLRRSKVYSAVKGHLIKTGALESVLEDNVIASLNAIGGRAIDAFAGNVVTLSRNVIQGGPNTENLDLIAYGTEASRLGKGPHRLQAQGNVFLIDDEVRGWVLFRRNSPLVDPYEIELRDNIIIGDPSIAGYVHHTGSVEHDSRVDAKYRPYDGTVESMK